jgi:signal transduction histidine kinase
MHCFSQALLFYFFYTLVILQDHGIGIPTEERTKVFERFYRVEDEETRSSKGTGLGLFLVNEIVKIHGGKINCKDNSPNGTIFEIKFRNNNG